MLATVRSLIFIRAGKVREVDSREVKIVTYVFHSTNPLTHTLSDQRQVSVANMFSEFIGNLKIVNAETISLRYSELTAALIKTFRDTESKTANTLQVGSFGRKTAINGISDLDMLYIMPKSAWDTYKNGKQLKLLQETKQAIIYRYPKTAVRVDRLVVTVTYQDFHVEVQPVFEQDEGSYMVFHFVNFSSFLRVCLLYCK